MSLNFTFPMLGQGWSVSGRAGEAAQRRELSTFGLAGVCSQQVCSKYVAVSSLLELDGNFAFFIPGAGSWPWGAAAELLWLGLTLG